jgi:hypothetical protein
MAGTTKDLTPAEIHQAPGDLWVLPAAPLDATPRMTLASNLTPDATAHPASVHLGAIASAITTTVKPKIAPIELEQFDAPFDGYLADLNTTLEAEMAQSRPAKFQRALGVATFSSGTGYEQVTFGGTLAVPKLCIAAISPKRTAPLQAWVTILFNGVAVGGFSVAMGRAKSSTWKLRFRGLPDLTRTPGQRTGILYETTVDAAGGTAQAKDLTSAEIFQGPADLWLISPAPSDADQRVTLDATTLTPDATVHSGAKHLGGTAGAVTLTVTPKIGDIKMDQADDAVDVFIDSIEAKIEAEMVQSEAQKLARALGLGTLNNYTAGTGYKQVTWGGSNQPNPICVAAIAPKRTTPTKAVVACLYNVISNDGFSLTLSRKKASSYKFTAIGNMDASRTIGRTIGIYHEMV